jgi:hypothetical protein
MDAQKPLVLSLAPGLQLKEKQKNSYYLFVLLTKKSIAHLMYFSSRALIFSS